MQEVLTKHIQEEIQFLEEELLLSKVSRIMEVGCGTGRRAIGLTKQGYRITSIDISEGMLAEARTAAK
jgi:ubiquinone/menaquinone biosynthesis C-methylase UbiE